MKINKLLLITLLGVISLTSCNKNHYDTGNVQGVNAEGELLLPIAFKSVTMMDMMERFKIDSLISCSPSGELSYNYCFEDDEVLSAEKLLTFKDMDFTEHYAFANPFIVLQPSVMDTMIRYENTIVFESDHISVLEAVMKTGRFKFHLNSNLGVLYRVILHSSDIKDSAGNNFVLDTELQANAFSFDLAGLRYLTHTPNTLTFSYELYFYLAPTNDPELFVDFNINGSFLSMSSMRGYVESYSERNCLDTVFSIFPDNLTGMLDVDNVNLTILERNTFPLAARMEIDTALLMGEGVEPYSLFEPMPLVVELPSQTAYGEVFSKSLHGRLNASGGSSYSSSNFIVNPLGVSEMVSVDDTCSIDLRLDVNIPFAFQVDDVWYIDTVNMNLSELDMPDMIESVTLELTFTSTIPLNLNGQFYMYNSEDEVIMDVLLSDARLIQASFDGQPATTTLSIDITEERVEHVLHSDRIIMAYALDTDSHDVVLNASQKLELYVKARVKYNGSVDVSN